MEIAIIADDTKKELMTQFCIAYCGILSQHNICATQITGRYIAEATGLNIECLLPGEIGGVQQIASRIAYNEIDMLLFFRDRTGNFDWASDEEILALGSKAAVASLGAADATSGLVEKPQLENVVKGLKRKEICL